MLTSEWNQERCGVACNSKKGDTPWGNGVLLGCHFDGHILATGLGYNSEMTRVVICGGQAQIVLMGLLFSPSLVTFIDVHGFAVLWGLISCGSGRG
uniref:Uncharacterized protein n=1 Tax=Romanomermis culicivorax TaxID=13658 RepID=A0A915K6T3_ROMCU